MNYPAASFGVSIGKTQIPYRSKLLGIKSEEIKFNTSLFGKDKNPPAFDIPLYRGVSVETYLLAGIIYSFIKKRGPENRTPFL